VSSVSALAFVLIATGCGAGPAPREVSPETREAFSDLLVDGPHCQRPGPETITREAMLADVDVLERILRRGYAGFELAGDEGRWARAFREMREDLVDEPASPRAFRDHLITRLRFADDNHLSLSIRGADGRRSWRATSVHQQAYLGTVRLTRGDDDVYRLTDSGMALVSCVDRPANDVVQPTMGESPPAVDYAPVVLSDTPRATLACIMADESGQETSLDVPLVRADVGDGDGPVFEERAAGFPWLRVRSLATSHGGALERFVATGPTLRDEPVIVLDVRGMGGGSDRFLLRWFKELTSERMPYFRTHTLESEVTLQGALNFWGCIRTNTRSADAEGRDWLRRRVSGAERELDERMRQRGPFREMVTEHDIIAGHASSPLSGRILLVVDRGCASACETSVIMARHFPGTLVVGENTQGTMKVGELRSYRLPGSGISVSAGHCVHEDPGYPDTFPEGIGYAPDLWLRPGDNEAQIRALATCLASDDCAHALDAALDPQ
jgi:hypothetical protein